jgi:hypothetical protein
LCLFCAVVRADVFLACSEQKDDPDEVRIQEEIKQYGDILRLDMVDTYADLSLKTLKMFTVLPQKYDADFYFKIDDDVAVNIDAMAAYLAAKRNQGNLYLVSQWFCQHSHCSCPTPALPVM